MTVRTRRQPLSFLVQSTPFRLALLASTVGLTVSTAGYAQLRTSALPENAQAEKCDTSQTTSASPSSGPTTLPDASAGPRTLRLQARQDSLTESPAAEPQCKIGEDSQASSAAAPAAPAKPKDLVTYANNTLTIHGTGASLAEVLTAVRDKSGMLLDVPAEASAERVYDSIGPLPTQPALRKLLDGSKFNYVMLSSSADESLVRSLILTPRSASSGTANVALAAAVAPAPIADAEEEPAPQPILPPPAPASGSILPSSAPAALREQAAALQQANPQMSRGEILGLLQRQHTEELDRQVAAQSQNQQ